MNAITAQTGQNAKRTTGGMNMDMNEFKDKMNSELPKSDWPIPADQAGVIRIEDIETISKESKEWPDENDPSKKNTQIRFMFTMKNRPERISCPLSAAEQLFELMQKSNVVAFQVLKTGSGLATKYSVSPMLG